MKKVFSRLVSTVLATAMLASSFVVTTPVSVLAAPSMTAGGWFETLYADISGVSDADVTAVSYSGTTSGSLTGEDLTYLVRDNGKGGVRIDIPGVPAGTYTLNVTTSSGTVTQSNIAVTENDRSGFAHDGFTTGVGAYKDDGTLKDNAIVLYVTEENKNTVTLEYGGKKVTGIGNILNSRGSTSAANPQNTNQGILADLARAGVPLVVRFIGSVEAGDSNTKGGTNPMGQATSVPSENIDGLTAYDSVGYGGTEGDNGMMARMTDAKNVTLEGIGYDATIDGWGIHYIASTAGAPEELGSSFEVRNLTFINYPEDAVGMEGQQEGSTITAPVQRVWIHNNSFMPGYCKNPAESDKAEGDGSCDFKRGYYMTMSYNYFYGAHKTNLVGSSDSSMQFHITWHHNMWENCMARGPLGRNADMHIYNNYYKGQTDYAMNPRANCYIFSEYNTFEYCKNPMEVDSGAIKSFNDVLISCSGSANGTVVTDRNAQVSSGNTYENFDTNSAYYVGRNDYKVQPSAAEAKATCIAYSGAMKEVVIDEGDVDTSIVEEGNTPVASVVLPFSVSFGKNNADPNSPTSTGHSEIANVIYNPTKIGSTDITIRGQGIVFNVAQDAKITMTGLSGSYVPELYDENGKLYISQSGTAIVPAGTYIIQSDTYDTGTAGFKEAKISSLVIEAANPGETVETTTIDRPTTEATTEATTNDVEDTTSEEDTEETTQAPPYTGEGLVWDKTSGTNTLNANVDANDWAGAEPVVYNGSTFTAAVKMESSTNITFNAPGSGILTLVTYSGKSDAAIKVNGESYAVSQNGSVDIPITSAGIVTITKGTTDTYLYVMEFKSNTSGEDSSSTSTETTTEVTTVSTTEATTVTESTTEATTQAPVEGINIAVADVSGDVGENVSVPVTVSGGIVSGYEAVVNYDTNMLTFVSAEAGNSDSGISFEFNETAPGTVEVAATNANDIETSLLFKLNFTVNTTGTSNISLSFNEIFGIDDADIIPTVDNGSVTVTNPSAGTMPGDVDLDKDVDKTDATILLRHISGIASITDPAALANADCDGTEGVDMADVIWILNNQTAASEDTTSTTEATTETTTKATTEATTETTTQAPVEADGIAAGTYTNSDILNNNNFTVTNNTSTSGEIKIDETGAVTFKVNDGANVTVTYKCGSSNSSKSAAVIFNGVQGEMLVGGSGSAAATSSVTVNNLPAGTYSVTAVQQGGTTAAILSIEVSYDVVVDTTTTEATTETTTKATTTTEATETTTEATETTTEATGSEVYSHNFTSDGTTSSFYTIAGNLSESKGTVNYGGLTLTQCLKMESSTSIKFNGAGTLTLIFNADSAGCTVELDGTEYKVGSDGTLVISDIPSGAHELTKGSGSSNLFYMVLSGSGSVIEPPTQGTTTDSEETTEGTTGETPDLEGAINIAAGDSTALVNAINDAKAGDVINLAPANYDMSKVLKLDSNGSASAPITLTCTDGMATLDFDGTSGAGTTVSGDYYDISNITFTNAGDNGMYVTGSHIDITNCIFQANYDTGLQISKGGNNVLVKNCTSFDNSWAENADGFAAKLGAGENVVFDGCISYNNADDGWDLYSKSGDQQNKYPITLRNCIAFNNGTLTDGTEFADGDRNGFKLGGSGYSTKNVVENCIAFNNGTCGFTDNNNPGLAVLKNCTGYKNAQIDVKKHNFSVYRASEGLAMTNCLSYILNGDPNGGMDRFEGSSSGTTYNANATVVNSVLGSGNKYYKVDNAKITNNTDAATYGTEVTITDSMFESLTLPYKSLQTVHTDMRNADGSIKLNGFLQPKVGTVIEGMGAQFAD